MIRLETWIGGIRPELLLGIMVAAEAFRSAGVDMRVTYCVEGLHRFKSRHYDFAAVDIGLRDVPDILWVPLRDKIDEALNIPQMPKQYDFVLERAEPHFHLEYDPKIGPNELRIRELEREVKQLKKAVVDAETRNAP